MLYEFLAADIVVIGAPMYNFTIPSQLKAWIDSVLVAGKTFKYSDKGAEGLAGGKQVIVASRAADFTAPKHRSRSSTIRKPTCAVFSASSASRIPSSFPPTASRSDPNIAKKRVAGALKAAGDLNAA